MEWRVSRLRDLTVCLAATEEQQWPGRLCGGSRGKSRGGRNGLKVGKADVVDVM